jgi:hypothetical protein
MATGAQHQTQLRLDPYATNTYLFRTGEGGYGVLQILASSTNPPGVRIQYKLVSRGGTGDGQMKSDSASQTNRDLYSGVTGHAFFCQGKPRAGLEGWEEGWKVEDGCLVNTNEAARISTKTRFGKEDLSVNATLSLDNLNGSGAAFTFGDGYAFEFDRAGGGFKVSGPTVLKSYQRLGTADAIVAGKRFLFTAQRRASFLGTFVLSVALRKRSMTLSWRT